MDSTKALICPTCGASIEEGQRRCDFCDSLILYSSDPPEKMLWQEVGDSGVLTRTSRISRKIDLPAKSVTGGKEYPGVPDEYSVTDIGHTHIVLDKNEPPPPPVKDDRGNLVGVLIWVLVFVAWVIAGLMVLF